jgi:hypothetical protein
MNPSPRTCTCWSLPMLGTQSKRPGLFRTRAAFFASRARVEALGVSVASTDLAYHAYWQVNFSQVPIVVAH